MYQRIVVKGEVDVASAPELLRTLDERVDADPGGTIEVDFRRVTFVDSCGLGVMVACQRRAQRLHGRITVVNPQPQVRRTFEATGLDSVLLAPGRRLRSLSA